MSGLKLFGYRIPGRQLVGGLLFWLVIGTVLWSTRDLPLYEEGAPGPRFMPVVLCAIFAVLAVLYWVEAATREPDAADAKAGERNLRRPAAFLGIVVLLALAWETLGAALSVLLCAFLELRFLERASLAKSIVASLVMAAAMIALFQLVLGVPLPGGVLEKLGQLRL